MLLVFVTESPQGGSAKRPRHTSYSCAATQVVELFSVIQLPGLCVVGSLPLAHNAVDSHTGVYTVRIKKV